MIKLCPKCQSERAITEVLCQGVVNDNPCGWLMTDVPIVSPEVSAVASRSCANGHPLGDGDLMCLECGEEEAVSQAAVIGDWKLGQRLSQSAVHERFLAERRSDGHQGVLTWYHAGSEPDPEVYALLRRIDLDHVPETLEMGRWADRAFLVSEELAGGSLADLNVDPSDRATVERVIDEVARALASFAELGLRHRDLRPGSIRIRKREPLDLVITGFGSARLSELDLDIVSPLETSRYMAPEAVMGGVSAASDWWSLGMIVLELVTGGACFQGVSEQLYLIHVLSQGVSLPAGLDDRWQLLLRGLLARERTQRWQYPQVRAWLAGESVSAPSPVAASTVENNAPPLLLGGKPYRSPQFLALEASRGENWEEASALLARGSLATWAEQAGIEARYHSALRQMSARADLSADLRLALALKLLNPALPLILREEIVSPGWLMDHPEAGYELVSGPLPELLKTLGFDSEDWLLRLSRRAHLVRQRAASLGVELQEDALRMLVLATSRARLSAEWELRRRFLPDTEHPGLASLLDRPHMAEEDLLLLCAAAPQQFRSRDQILAEADQLAANVSLPLQESDPELTSKPRRELYFDVDRRIEGFARCGNDQVDSWADQFRLSRRLPLEQALILLRVAPERWQKPAHQHYVSAILSFFEKKVAGSILRGPLVRMTLGKTTPRIDLSELTGEPAALLDNLLLRSDQILTLDPKVFAGPNNPEQRLRNLVSRTVAYQRDTGINGLYLGFPFLLRRDRPGAKVRPRLAPVLLWPIKVNAEVGARGRVSLAFDRDRDEVRLNPAFEGMLGLEATGRWREAANELRERTSLRLGEVMDALGVLAGCPDRTLRPLPGAEADVPYLQDRLVGSAVLFHVEFLGQAIVEDLRQLQAVPPAGSALEVMLRVGGKSADDPETVPAGENFLMSPSDPSQEQAVARAWQPPGLLVQGPPGTGKSQTIVNLVGDAIGRGKSLLIVCQKLPALEVVRKRLVAEGLGDRLAMVTDVHRDRQPLLRAVRDQLDRFFEQSPVLAEAKARQRALLTEKIAGLEAEIDRHHQAVGKVDPLTHKSYREILGDLLAIESEGPILDVPQLRRMLAEWAPGAVERLEETCGALAQDWLPAHFEESALSVTLPFAADRATTQEFARLFGLLFTAERGRCQLLTSSSPGPELEDDVPTDSWLQAHEHRWLHLSQPVRSRLAELLPAFAGEAPARTYLQLLGELNVLQQKHARACLDIPALQALPTDLGKWAPTCAEMAELWLAARYENSPLAALQSFAPEPQVVSDFKCALEAFVDCEQARRDCLARSHPGWETEQAEAVEDWLERSEEYLLSLSDGSRRALSTWLPLFRGGDRRGPQLLAALEELAVALRELDPRHHHDELFGFFSELTPLLLGEWKQRASLAAAPASTLLARINPRRLLARQRVAGQLKKLGEPARFLDFFQQAGQEERLRQIRKAFKPIAEELGREVPTRPLPLGEFRAQLTGALDLLNEVQRACQLAEACPYSGKADGCLTDPTALQALFEVLRGAIQRCQARRGALTALGRLSPFVQPAWLTRCEARINEAGDSDPLTRPLLGALSTVVAYQEFRGRLTALDPVVTAIFQALSSLRGEWEALHSAELVFEVGRTVNREQKLKEKAALEKREPILRSELPLGQARKVLSELDELVNTLVTCPRQDDLRLAVAQASQEALPPLFRQMRDAVDRYRSRRDSTQALSKLEGWLEPSWLSQRRQEIASGVPSWAALDPVHGALPTLPAYQVFRQRSQTLSAEVMQAFAQLSPYRAQLAGGYEVKRILRREANLGWKNRLESDEPLLHANRDELDFKVRSLAQAAEELRRRNREHLAAYIDRDKIVPRKQWDDVLMLSGARARRLREVLTRAPEYGLLTLRPIWLMNPEVASQLLPCNRAMFDLVIYDEASQMPVEFALPTLFRAKNVVVSGDDKQMPPTSFFASKVESDEAETFDGECPEEDASDEERDQFEETWNRREIKDCPDLLHLAGAALPQVTLQIHYRSAYRELINFSNATFYHNDLSVPVRHPADEVRRLQPIELVRVDGVYEEQANPGEALAVVDYLARLWSRPDRPSVGVVTFNRKQADLILVKLEERAETDPAFRSAYAEELERQDGGEDMAVFVKNVENVQGDERDLIIFSTTFGRNRMGVFRRNFGVLGQKGGERRLNVAVTRARKKIAIMTSIPIHDISDMLSSRRGLGVARDYLQAYLEYARLLSQGDLDEAEALRNRLGGETRTHAAVQAHRDGLAQSVENFLRSLGYQPVFTGEDPALGLDFALIHPSTGLFGIGIECEAPSHRLLARARAREIWRPDLLRRAYQVVHRVSAHGWYHQREAEQNRLQTAIEQALREVALERA